MNKWTRDFPSENGMFWFYGYAWGKGSRAEPELECCKVMGPVSNSSGGTSFLASTGGAFVFENEAIGLWMKIEIPELPTDIETPELPIDKLDN